MNAIHAAYRETLSAVDMSNELCPASAPFFGFMGAAVALIFASAPLRSTNMRAAPGAGTVCALACTSQAELLFRLLQGAVTMASPC